jgi:transketolase
MGNSEADTPVALLPELFRVARKARRDSLRMIHQARSGSPGSTLSAVDILVWLLLHEMQICRDNFSDERRDRFILSKGQASPAFYSILHYLGHVSDAELLGYRQVSTRLQTHPEYRTIPQVDFPSGSLGMGLSAANGMALAARYQKRAGLRFFCLVGDGELQEGQIWEAAMTASHYGLENVVLIVDMNNFQGDSALAQVLAVEPIFDKFVAFGWEVANADGHDMAELTSTLRQMNSNRPKAILAHTTKGKGVSFMENNNAWHTGGAKFSDELLALALSELSDDA